jgi:hypothetical protein
MYESSIMKPNKNCLKGGGRRNGVKKEKYSLALVAHVYNPSCSRGREQEDHGSMPAQANSS